MSWFSCRFLEIWLKKSVCNCRFQEILDPPLHGVQCLCWLWGCRRHGWPLHVWSVRSRVPEPWLQPCKSARRSIAFNNNSSKDPVRSNLRAIRAPEPITVDQLPSYSRPQYGLIGLNALHAWVHRILRKVNIKINIPVNTSSLIQACTVPH